MGTDIKEALKAQLNKQAELFAGSTATARAPVERPRLAELREQFLAYKRLNLSAGMSPVV